MDIKWVATSLTALVVAVLVIAMVAIPVVEESVQGTQYHGSNTPDATFTYQASSPSFSWSRSSTGAMSLTIGGVTSDITGTSDDFVVATDKFTIRSISSGAQLWDYTNSTYTLSQESDIVISLTMSSGSYSLAFGGSTLTGSASWALIKDPNGTWGRYSSTFRATIGQPVIMGHLYTSDYGPYNLVSVTNGTVGSYLINPYTYSGTTITASEVSYTVGYSQSGEGQAVGVYGSMSMSWGDSNSSDNFRFYAPIEYSSTGTGDGGITGTLLGIIPLLLIIVAVMMAVRILKDA